MAGGISPTRVSCQEALRRLFAAPETFLTLEDVYRELDKAYPDKPWKQSTIYLHLNFFSVNNPRRKHHTNTEGKCFLFWDGADGFRKGIPEQDGVWKLANGDPTGIIRANKSWCPHT